MRIFSYIFSIAAVFGFIQLISCSSEVKNEKEINADSLQLIKNDSLTKAKMDSLKSDSLAFFFAKYKVTGSFLLFDPQKGKYYVHRKSWHKKPMSPASTFKVANALIALETGAMPNTTTFIKWDGKDRGVEEWNKDHNMTTAMQVSAVWFYQDLARRIGTKRMQHYINTLNYGNKNIGDTIDNFWLNNTMKITMEEQVNFMRALYKEELPLSRSTMVAVKKMLVLEETPDYILSGKTGWGTSEEPNIGWFVGYLMRKNNTGYYFATVIEMEKDEQAILRKDITVEILRHLHLTDPIPKPVLADSTAKKTEVKPAVKGEKPKK